MKQYFKILPHYLFDLIFARVLMPDIRKREIKTILLSGYTGLGHFILKSVLVQKLQELFPESKISIIAGNSYGTEFVLNDYPTFILKQERNWLNKIFFFLQLRQKKIDLILLPIDASPKFLIRGAILAGIPRRVGHVFETDDFPDYYYTSKVLVGPGKKRSELDMNYDLIDAITPSKIKRSYRPFVSMNFNGSVLEKNKLEKDKYICIQMGASNGNPTTKRWLKSHFRKLILMLIEKHPELSIVPLGDKGDEQIVNQICDGIYAAQLKNVAGKTTIEETKSLIASCKMLICHDSGLLHLGNALGRNVIALYGPSNPDFYALNMPTCHILQKTCDCIPLLGLFPGKFGEPTEEEAAKKCPVPKCMERLKPEEVYSKCVELL